MEKLLFWIYSLSQILQIVHSQRMVFSSNTFKLDFDQYVAQSTLVNEANSSISCRNFRLQIRNKPYVICINHYNVTNTGLLSDQTEIIMQYLNYTENFKFVDNLNLTSGYVMNYEGDSYVKGYLCKNRFFGKVFVDSEIYCVEPIRFYRKFEGRFLNDYDAVVFLAPASNNVTRYEVNTDMTSKFGYFSLPMNPHYGKFFRVTRKTCTLVAAIDNSFVQVIGKGIVDVALPRMILNLDEANSILRSADFDGDGIPDDIGVELKTVLILSSKSAGVGSIIETPIDQHVNPKILLKAFTTLEPLKLYCLAILFTAQPFQKRFLGVSFTPSKSVFDRRKLAGICASYIDLGFSLNTLAITHRLNDGSVMPSSLAELNLAHELAHAFGSDHDDEECEPDRIMQPKAGIPRKAENLEFSSCSKLSISTILRKQGHCLKDSLKSFCGNGIVEEGEECDCGSTTHCLLSDKCCVPRSLPRMCNVKEYNVQCHPSQGICCDDNCRYRDLKRLGLDCKNFNSRCPCTKEQRPCHCGIFGTCIGNECHSYDCTRVGLKECVCPKQIDGYCRHCCIINGNCTTATYASQQMLKQSKIVLESSKKYSGNKLTTNVTICNREEICFKLDFRQYQSMSVCTLFGKVGICNNGQCFMTIEAQERAALLSNSAMNVVSFSEMVMMIFIALKIIF
nr:disintegrin and metalloproteinase domain-containing protein 10-like isoform X1 [Onthophagus taurus]